MNQAVHVRMVKLVIVYGTNKDVEVGTDVTIALLKAAAMAAFSIPDSEAPKFILKAKIKGEDNEQLDEAKTVEDYHLHNNQKVILASGTPFGSR